MSWRAHAGGALTAAVIVASLTVAGAQRSGLDTRVNEAARMGDVASLRALVRQRIDVNAEVNGFTPLLWAAYRSDAEMARLLLAAGADPDRVNRLGMTPMLLTSRNGDAQLVELLLKAGVSARSAYYDGETALMAAAGAGSARAVRLLLDAGADVNARERVQEQTALMWAAIDGHSAVVRTLLDAGADVNAVARPTRLAHEDGNGGRIWPDFPTGGLTALMFAARQGHLDVARLLADRGAALDVANPDGLTAMMMAILNDRLDLAAMLLDKGAPVNDGSLYEVVRLHNLAADEPVPTGTNSVARPWPDHDNLASPLDLITRLVERGADPNRIATHILHPEATHTPAPIDQSPLRRALQAQDVAAVRALLGRGASPDVVEGGVTSLMSVAGLVRPAAGRGAPPALFRYPAQRDGVAVARTLLDAGADVNAASPVGDTALHAAAQSGNVAIVQLLADAGARLDARNSAGLTPLDVASGRQAPGAPAAGRGGARGRGGRGGVPQPQPQAMALLRKLMGLPESTP